MKSYETFRQSENYRQLLEQYSLDTLGVWDVYGEDPNCDLGGSHIRPYLGSWYGSLRLVLHKAVNRHDFWSWGYGGNIKLNADTDEYQKRETALSKLTDEDKLVLGL